jgi:hypothetical protein
MVNMQPSRDADRIELLRGGAVVSSLAGSFGSALRETRLTAMLAYVMAIEPERFCEIFAFRGRPISVSLETRHESDRSDVLVETTAGLGLIASRCGQMLDVKVSQLIEWLEYGDDRYVMRSIRSLHKKRQIELVESTGKMRILSPDTKAVEELIRKKKLTGII